MYNILYMAPHARVEGPRVKSLSGKKKCQAVAKKVRGGGLLPRVHFKGGCFQIKRRDRKMGIKDLFVFSFVFTKWVTPKGQTDFLHLYLYLKNQFRCER